MVTERYAEPFTEPDGRMTWAVREYVYESNYIRRTIVSWHETRSEAEDAIKDWYRLDFGAWHPEHPEFPANLA